MASKLLPDGLVPSGSSPEFTEGTMPDALLREHALGAGHWGLLNVLEGSVAFVDISTGDEQVLTARGTVPIHPQEPHRLIVSGPVRVQIDFFVEQSAA